MQWRGFQSLRGQEIPRVLSNDLTELERYLKQLGDRIASLLSEEPISGGGATSNAAAKVNEPYVVATASSELTQERVLTQGTGITVTDSGPNSTITVAIDSTVITGAGVATRGTFWTGTNTIGSDAAFYWDNVTKQLQIVTTAGTPLRLGYDTDDYVTMAVNSSGMLTIDAISSASDNGKIRIQDDLVAINMTPSGDAWFEIQNQGSDPAADVLALTPWGWWSGDYVDSGGSSAYTDGQNIANSSVFWYDRAPGHTRPLELKGSSAAYVTFQTNEQNGYPGLLFLNDASWGEFPSSQSLTSYSVFMVYKKTASNNTSFVLSNTGSATEFLQGPSTGTDGISGDFRFEGWRVSYGDPSVAGYCTLTNLTFTASDYNVFALTRSGTSHVTYLNSASAAATRTTNENGFTFETAALEFNRFRTTGASNGNEITYLEIIIFDSVLGTTDRGTVIDYLNNKYTLNGGIAPADTFDFIRRYNTDGDMLYRMDSSAQILSSDIDYTTALASRLTLIDAGGDMFDMGINIAGPYLSHWELTTLTGNRIVTIPDETGTILVYAPTSVARGDIIRRNATNWENYAKGASGTILRSDGTDPVWATLSTAGIQPLDTDLTEIAAVSNVRGDLLLTDASAVWVRLAIGSSGTILRSDGSDAAWASLSTAGIQPLDADLTQIAAVSNVRGDILVTDSTPDWVRLAVGGASTLLQSNGTDPSWGTVNLLSAFHGDTTASTVARGDVITGQTASPKWARLSIGASGTVLSSDGTDVSWASVSGAGAQPLDTDLTEIAAVSNVRGDLLLTDSGPTWVRLGIGASGTLLRSDGTDAAWASLSTAGIQPLDTDLTEIAAVSNVRGDLLLTNSSTVWDRLAVGSSGTILRSDGTDAAWASLSTAGIQPLDTDLTEIAAVANVRGDLLLTNSGPTWVRLGIGSSGTFLKSDGTDAAWATPTAADVGALSNSTSSVQDGYFGDVYLFDDSTPSHYLKITNAANLSAQRVLSFSLGNVDRTFTASGTNLSTTFTVGSASMFGTNTGDDTAGDGLLDLVGIWEVDEGFNFNWTGQHTYIDQAIDFFSTFYADTHHIDGSGNQLVFDTIDGSLFKSSGADICNIKDGTFQIYDGIDWQIGTVTGSKFGLSNTAKLGFWGTTPVVRTSAGSGWVVTGEDGTTKGYTVSTATVSQIANTLGNLIEWFKQCGLLE